MVTRSHSNFHIAVPLMRHIEAGRVSHSSTVTGRSTNKIKTITPQVTYQKITLITHKWHNQKNHTITPVFCFVLHQVSKKYITISNIFCYKAPQAIRVCVISFGFLLILTWEFYPGHGSGKIRPGAKLRSKTYPGFYQGKISLPE